MILILAKYYIFKTKEKNQLPNIRVFKEYIIYQYRADQYIACESLNQRTNEEYWKPVITLIN